MLLRTGPARRSSSEGDAVVTICVIQARMGSARLPGKVLADVGGRPMLAFLLARLRRLPVDEIVVATTTQSHDDAVADVARSAGASVVRGVEDDVLGRFASVLDVVPADWVVRLTADCPLTDPSVVQSVIELGQSGPYDYACNVLPRTFPRGLDVEVMDARVLRTAARLAVDPVEREHVTPFLMRHPERFRLSNLRATESLGRERWTVDTAEDLSFVRSAVAAVGDPDAPWTRILGAVGRRAVHHDKVLLRPADMSDAERLLGWRNDPEVVRLSVSGEPTKAAGHWRWLRQRVNDPSTRLWIAEIDAVPCGQVRVDVEDAIGAVSISVAAERRGQGIGRSVLRALLDELEADHQTRQLTSVVHVGNHRSLGMFSSLGFTEVGQDGTFVRLSRTRGALRYDEGATICLEPSLSAGPTATGDVTTLASVAERFRDDGGIEHVAQILELALVTEDEPTNQLTRLGFIHQHLEDLEGAARHYEEALVRTPNSGPLYSNLGAVLTALGRHDEACAAHRRATALDPSSPHLVWNMANALLAAGQLSAGWEAYESRLQVWGWGLPAQGLGWEPGQPPPARLRVLREQGLADEVLFGSCYPDLLAETSDVVIDCDPRLASLLRRSFPGTAIEPSGETASPAKPPAPSGTAIAAGSLPRRYRQRLDTFPSDQGAYLRADPCRVDLWRRRLANLPSRGTRIGISWRSIVTGAHRRLEYASLLEWFPVLRLPDVSFVDLQYGDGRAELAEAAGRLGVQIHHFDDLDLRDDLEGVAALIAALDVVVAPRNAVAHLAGAIGTPTVMIANSHGWTQLGTNHFPWFGSVTVLARRRGEPWRAALQRFADPVAAIASGCGRRTCE